MKNLLLAGFLLLTSLMPMSLQADELVLADGAPEVYIVKKGDTLWGISNMYLRDPWLWPEIWQVNPQLDNPHLIYPGDEIYLVWVDGRPQLRVKRGQTSRTVKLTPTMRVEPLDLAIPAVSLEEIGAWLKNHRIVPVEEMDNAPYVVAGEKRRILSAAGDQFYARGEFPEGETGFGIFRRGDIYVDPDTNEVLGVQAADIGSAVLEEDHDGDITQLEVTRVTEEVRNADRLLPNETRSIDSTFYPRAPGSEIDAFMIAVDGGVSQIGTMDVVAVNRGQREGMEAGTVLAIFQTGEEIRDPITREKIRMPDQRAGLLMVFRTFEKMSYGIVMRSDRPLAVGDRVTNP